VKQMVTMIQIRHTDKNTPQLFYSTVVYVIQLDAINENTIFYKIVFSFIAFFHKMSLVFHRRCYVQY